MTQPETQIDPGCTFLTGGGRRTRAAGEEAWAARKTEYPPGGELDPPTPLPSRQSRRGGGDPHPPDRERGVCGGARPPLAIGWRTGGRAKWGVEGEAVVLGATL